MNISGRLKRFEKYLDTANLSHKQYQYDAVKWMLHNELSNTRPTFDGVYIRGGFIADEMGLGKTIMLIGLMLCNFVKHTLIVLPPVLIKQWAQQIKRTTGHTPLIYYGGKRHVITKTELENAPVVLTSYGCVKITKEMVKHKMLTKLHTVFWDRIIFDESHHLRNKKKKLHTIYVGCRMLRASLSRWLVSGTPVQNSRHDLYSLCEVLRLPKSFYKKLNNRENLLNFVKYYLLKRTKKQVGLDIVPVIHKKIVVKWHSSMEFILSGITMSHLNPEYALESYSWLDTITDPEMIKYRDIITDALLDTATFNEHPFAKWFRAKLATACPNLLMKDLRCGVRHTAPIPLSADNKVYSKLKAVIQLLKTRKDNGSGKLVFCFFKYEMETIKTQLCGGQNRYNDDEVNIYNHKQPIPETTKVLILQIFSGSEGLNFQDNYSEVYFSTPWWNPKLEDQAIARCHRIGQKKTVYVFKFIMEQTSIDKIMRNIQNGKNMLTRKIFIVNDENPKEECENVKVN